MPGPTSRRARHSAFAGLLMSLDGLEFVLSRTGILDIFLMTFVLAAFGCLVIDRDVSRDRLAGLVARGAGGVAAGGGPRLGLRRWQLACGVLLGLAVGTKWIAAWYIVAFAGLFLAWEIGARRAAGLGAYVRGAPREAVWLPLTFVVVPLAVYLASWSGWFATGTGFYRDYAQQHGVNIPVISPLYSLFEYHLQAIGFGLGLNTPHPYQSQPWDWLLMTRPVAFYAQCYTGPANYQACPRGTVGRGRAGRRVPAERAADVLVFLSDPRGQDHHLPGLVEPHLGPGGRPRLDLRAVLTRGDDPLRPPGLGGTVRPPKPP